MASTHSLLHSLAQTRRDLSEILASANRFLSHVTQQESFVTLFLGRLDPQSRRLTYASAGHPTGYVLDRLGAVKARLESTGPALAVIPDATFPAGDSIFLESGDMVILLTDGALEAASPERVLFGEQRVIEVVTANCAKPASEIIRRLFQAVLEFSRRERPIDDLTALVIKAG